MLRDIRQNQPPKCQRLEGLNVIIFFEQYIESQKETQVELIWTWAQSQLLAFVDSATDRFWWKHAPIAKPDSCVTYGS